jgi:hypothetical protein
MGAIEVTRYTIGKYKNYKHAWDEIYDEDRYENGHDYYSGGISNCMSPELIAVHPKYGSKKFNEWVEDKLSIAHKQDCFCVEITGAALKRVKGNFWKGRRGIKAFYFFGIAPY